MYTKISGILDEAFQDQWFLDSGSLLGIVRDCKFLSSDKGIDLSVIIASYNDKRIELVREKFEELGFITSRYVWNGITFKYCFSPNSKMDFFYAVDLHFFVVSGNEYICPQISLNYNKGLVIRKLDVFLRNIRKGNSISRANTFAGRLKWYVAKTYRDLRYFNKPMDMSKYVKLNCGDTYFWVIPFDMYHGTAYSKHIQLRELLSPEDYLQYRYGDWRTPNPNWNTLRDDGGIRKAPAKSIDEIVERA